MTGGGRLDGIIVGNPDLKPEKSLSEELALLWDNNDNLNAGVTLFNTDFKDKITEVRRCNSSADPACTIGDHSYDFVSDRVNVDKANMRGVESSFGWKITRDVNWTANYTYTESEQKSGQFSGKPLNKMPKHMFNTTTDWQATPDVGFWSRLNLRGKTSEYLSRTSMSRVHRPTLRLMSVCATTPTKTCWLLPVCITCSISRLTTIRMTPCWMAVAIPLA